MKRLIVYAAVVTVGLWSSGAALAADQKNVSPASSGMVRSQDPQSLVAAMLAGKYEAKLGKDKVGDPMITSAVQGTAFQVYFYNCTANKECATITFHSGYALQNKPTADLINQWNRAKRFGRAYLDKVGDPILEMDIDLDDGGISPALFVDNLEFWASLVPDFEKHIGYRK
jgi:type 1 fimbria pilin